MSQPNRPSRQLFAVMFTLLSCAAVSNADQVNWSNDVEAALRAANSSGRPVLMKFTADWCGYCKKMEKETFTKPRVAQLVNSQFVPVLVDADQHKDLVQHLKITGLPSTLIVSPEMVILSRISGFQTEDKLLPQLETVVAQHSGSRASAPTVAGSGGFAPAPTRPVSAQTKNTPPAVSQPAADVQTPAPVANQFASQQPGEFVEAAAAPPGPAFGGLCLTSVTETRTLVSGMPQIAAQYRGKILNFNSVQQMEKFQANPATFWPALDGACPVTLVESGKTVEGKLEYAAMFRGKVWVMNSMDEMQKFVAQPAKYVSAVETR